MVRLSYMQQYGLVDIPSYRQHRYSHNPTHLASNMMCLEVVQMYNQSTQPVRCFGTLIFIISIKFYPFHSKYSIYHSKNTNNF